MKIMGGCRICGEQTEHVIKWNNKTTHLCVSCAKAIREYDPKLEDRALTLQIGKISEIQEKEIKK